MPDYQFSRFHRIGSPRPDFHEQACAQKYSSIETKAVVPLPPLTAGQAGAGFLRSLNHSRNYPRAMKAVLLALIGFMCVGGVSVMSADRPARGRMKGMELYSWPEHGKWMFVLLDGTNALKSEEQVKKSPNRVDTIAALGAQFMELAKGETVVWNFHFVPGFSFPDKKSFAEITAAAKRAEINLIPDRNKESQSDNQTPETMHSPRGSH